MRLGVAALGVAVLMAGCGGSGQPDGAALHVIGRRPPARKDVIHAVLAHHSVSLTVDASCMGVGTEAADSTIGAYLSGFLAALIEDGHNWLETSVVDAESEAGIPVWRAELIIRRASGEDEWGWGVRFDVRRENGAVVPESFRCIGAG